VKNQNTGLSEREEFFMIGEKIYEYDLDITGVADFGVSLQAIAAGEVTDYLRLRADGRLNLDIRATIETGDGHRIALSAGGVGVPRAGEPITDLFERMSHHGSCGLRVGQRATDLGRGDRELCYWQDSRRGISAMKGTRTGSPRLAAR
jgi:hypothetical protein